MNDDLIGRTTRNDSKSPLHDTHGKGQENSRVRNDRAFEHKQPGIRSLSGSTPDDVLRAHRIRFQLAMEFDRSLTDADLHFLRSSGIRLC